MSQRPRRFDVVLRRRVRESQWIEMPVAEEPKRPTSVRERAKWLAFVLLGIMVGGALLLATPLTTQSGERTPFVDALFTSVSAVAVTGLVTVDTGTHWNALGQLIILLLIQIGGLGIMVGAGILFQVSRRGRPTLKDSLYISDGAPSISLDDALSLTRQITLFTFTVEAIGAIILFTRFVQDLPIRSAAWHAVFHSVSAFCNAGFDLQGGYRSLSPYRDSVLINLAVMILVLFGAVSWLVVRDVITVSAARLRQRRREAISLDTRLVLGGNVVLIVIGFVSILAIEWRGMLSALPTSGKLGAALFQATASRTSGFSTVDWATANPLSLFVWQALMMVGGASASTTGGVKITTVAVLLIAVISVFRGQQDAEVARRRMPSDLIMRAMAVVAAFLLLHFVGSILIVISQFSLRETERELEHILFETMSGLATVGLSTGFSQELNDASKVLMCLLMFVGRLGPITLAYALQMRSRPGRYRLPQGQVRIG